MVVIFAGIEFDRMVLVYTAIAESAKAGVRYAIVHGNNRTGLTGTEPQCGPSDNPAPVVALIKGVASSGVLDTALLTNANCATSTSQGICVTYPNGANRTGDPVVVRVVYPYDPFVALPLRVNLSATARGIIAF
jgi:hypothetical protein